MSFDASKMIASAEEDSLVLARTTLLSTDCDPIFRSILTSQYKGQKDPKARALISIANAIITQKREYLIITRTSLLDLVKNDENFSIRHRGTPFQNKDYGLILKACGYGLLDIVRPGEGNQPAVYRVKDETILDYLKQHGVCGEDQLNECINFVIKPDIEKKMKAASLNDCPIESSNNSEQKQPVVTPESSRQKQKIEESQPAQKAPSEEPTPPKVAPKQEVATQEIPQPKQQEPAETPTNTITYNLKATPEGFSSIGGDRDEFRFFSTIKRDNYVRTLVNIQSGEVSFEIPTGIPLDIEEENQQLEEAKKLWLAATADMTGELYPKPEPKQEVVIDNVIEIKKPQILKWVFKDEPEVEADNQNGEAALLSALSWQPEADRSN
jgi:hypothetical protein